MKWYHGGLQNPSSGFEPRRPCTALASKPAIITTMNTKKRASSHAYKKIIYILIITILALIAGWKLYEAIFISHAPAVEVSSDPIKYDFYKRPINPKTPETDKTNKLPQDLGNGVHVIPELGVKIRLPEGLRSLVYYPEEIRGHKYIRLSTAELTNLGEYCVASQSPLGVMGRTEFTELKDDVGDPHAWVIDAELMEKYSNLSQEIGFTQPPYVKRLDSFYIYFEGPQATCSEDESVQSVQSSQTKLIPSIIQTIEKL